MPQVLIASAATCLTPTIAMTERPPAMLDATML